MVEFRGVVNFDSRGEVSCFCSKEDSLRGKCICRNRGDDCPEAIISVEVVPGTRPSEKLITDVGVTKIKVDREVKKIKEGLSKLEDAVKRTNFKF